MNNEKPPIKVSREFELVSPGGEKAFGMPISEWGFLKRKIKRMKSPDNLFLVIATIFLGVSGSNGYLIKFTKIEETLKDNLLISFFVTLLIGILCLLFHFLRGKEVACSKEDILDDMDRIEKTYSKLD
jgi:hypothetical protein